MALFGREKIRVVNFKEDYSINVGYLQVEEYASDVVTKKKNGIRDKSWELAHPLLKRCYGIPGIPEGEKALLICSRDVVFNPLNQYSELYSKEAIRKRMGEMAREQQHKADSSHGSGVQNITGMLLGGSAVLLFLAIVIISFLKYYRGG